MRAVLLFLLLPAIAIAQTNVSGFISANTTWTVAGSPYILTGNALVSHGYTLTIEPGVVVKFNTDKALQIDGELIAIGTPAARITFTSNQPAPAAGDWAKIHFPDTCVDAVFDTNGAYVSGSIMKYCDVLYGGGLGFGAIHVKNSHPYISRCNISHSAADGIRTEAAFPIIDSSMMQHCVGRGLSLNFSGLNACHSGIQTDTFKSNGNGGLLIGGVNPPCPILVSGNYFISNYNGSAILAGAHYLKITHNYFFDNSPNHNSNGVINMGSVRYDTIECNRFINNKNGAAIYKSSPAGGIIRNNIFDGNIDSSGNGVINYQGRTSTTPLYFSNNIVRNNISLGSACLYFYPNVLINQHLHFNNNYITNNTATSVLRIRGFQENNNSNNFLYMKQNSFIDNHAPYLLYNEVPYGSPDLYADGNYWGSTDPQYIDSVIYDYFDFANQSVVYYTPILTQPAPVDSTCASWPVELSARGFATNINCGRCEGTATVRTIEGTPPFTFYWSTGDTTQSIDSLCAGTYYVSVTDGLGAVASDSVVVSGTDSVFASIQSTLTAVCIGDSIRLCVDNIFPTYLWNTGATTRCIYVRSAGDYAVTVSHQNGCVAESNPLHIDVHPLPVADFTVSNDTLIASYGEMFQWFFYSTPIPGATHSIYVPDVTGRYTVLITDSNGCSAMSPHLFVAVTGVEESEWDNTRIYPNPFSEMLYIETITPTPFEVVLYDVFSREILRKTFTGATVIDTRTLAGGIYFYELRNEKGVVRNGKVLKGTTGP